MEKINTARHLAFHVLLDIEKNRAYANLALDKALLHSTLEQSDRRMVTEIVYGCVKMRDHIDNIIKSYCDLKRLDRRSLLILRMAIYQMDFMDKIPDHAIINESVELTKILGIKSDKLVNALLRSYQRKEKAVSWPDKRKQRNQYLAKWYSFPQWMIDIWVKEYGFKNTEELCQYFNAPAKTWIRVNTLKSTLAEVTRYLDEHNVEYSVHKVIKNAIKVHSLQKIIKSPLFSEGKIIVQDLSTLLPTLALNPHIGAHVLDMCAAPGGKTTHLSAIMENTGEVTACDIHEHRVKLINQNSKRMGAKNIQTIVGDARNLPDCYYHTFDFILLDAPCSGLGVLNRRADLRWNIRKSNIQEIVQLQEELLEAAAKYLKKQGVVVYSTCTLNKNENELQIQKFLKAHPDFILESFECLNEVCEPGFKTIYPFFEGSDGFFIARLVRKE